MFFSNDDRIVKVFFLNNPVGGGRVRTGAVVLLVLMSSSCEDKEPTLNGATSSKATHSYALEINGIDKDITAGTLVNATVRIKRDGREFKGARVRVSVKIVCGMKDRIVQQAMTDKGVATFAAFKLDDRWAGRCTATAAAKVNNQDLTQSMAFILSVQLPVLIAGQEYGVNALRDGNGVVYSGFLSLGSCDGGQVLAITDNKNDPIIFSVSGDGVAINRGKNWRYVVFAHLISDCKLLLASSMGALKYEIRKILTPPASENLAYGKITALRQKNKKLVVVTKKVREGSLYVYDHAKDTWRSVSKVNWGGATATAINWSPQSSNNRVVIRVTHGGKSWWHFSIGHTP